jgi:hypothetical protein
VSGGGSATSETAVETGQRIEAPERQRMPDSIRIEMGMTLDDAGHLPQEHVGVVHRPLERVAALCLRGAHGPHYRPGSATNSRACRRRSTSQETVARTRA